MVDILNDSGDGGATNQVGERGLGMAALLNPSTKGSANASAEVGEQGVGRDKVDSESVTPEAMTTEAAVEDQQPTQQGQEEVETDGAVRPSPSPEDAFKLNSERFTEEQAGTPWMQAKKAFLEDGALALNPHLRVQTLKMAPHFVVRSGILMQKVYFRARSSPAYTIVVTAIPVQFIRTLLRYCHADIFVVHIGKNKTAYRVRKHAYWPV
ncbi:hypothetical protein PC121_g20518 [Phytophthora cactorum]|nr:hypothetical protein PC120_g20827 [Phytophthora cactorum]KAG3046706.1 hypothetical protein PC121_g20518 [Phytophthora cactorum]